MNTPSQIMFSQVREDPNIDLLAIEKVYEKLKTPLSSLIITSGGCTTLSLLCSPRTQLVVSYDANPAQNFLLELRVALLNNISSEQYLNAIQGKDATESFELAKDSLSSQALAFWMKHIDEVKKGINQSGRFEELFKELSFKIQKELGDYKKIDFSLSGVNEYWNTIFQQVFEREKLAQEYGRNAVDFSMSKEFGDHFSDVFRAALIKYTHKENYFIDQIFNNCYLKTYPQYIDQWKQNFDKKLHIKEGSFLSQLASIPDHSFHFIQLSNITDWMPTQEMQIIFATLQKKIVKGGALLTRRLNGDHSLEEEVAKVFATDSTMNKELKEMDRSFFYSEVVLGFNE